MIYYRCLENVCQHGVFLGNVSDDDPFISIFRVIHDDPLDRQKFKVQFRYSNVLHATVKENLIKDLKHALEIANVDNPPASEESDPSRKRQRDEAQMTTTNPDSTKKRILYDTIRSLPQVTQTLSYGMFSYNMPERLEPIKCGGSTPSIQSSLPSAVVSFNTGSRPSAVDVNLAACFTPSHIGSTNLSPLSTTSGTQMIVSNGISEM
jgi:hypothetical protein